MTLHYARGGRWLTSTTFVHSVSYTVLIPFETIPIRAFVFCFICFFHSSFSEQFNQSDRFFCCFQFGWSLVLPLSLSLTPAHLPVLVQILSIVGYIKYGIRIVIIVSRIVVSTIRVTFSRATQAANGRGMCQCEHRMFPSNISRTNHEHDCIINNMRFNRSLSQTIRIVMRSFWSTSLATMART